MKKTIIINIIFFFLSSNIVIADHNLKQIEKKCEVYKYSDRYGELDCSRGVDDRRSLEKKCEVYFSGKYGEFECRGSHFRNIEKKCEAYLYSSKYAEIDC